MATLANIFQRSTFMVTEYVAAPGPDPDGDARRGQAAADPYRLRKIPCADVFLHTKHIDNSRVVRESDPRSGPECWKTIGAFTVILAMLVMVAVPILSSTIAGYRLHDLQREEQRLVDERKVLEVELAHEINPAHLDVLAKQKHLTAPVPGQVVRLDAQSSEALASVFSKR